jgi:hypothetical protein
MDIDRILSGSITIAVVASAIWAVRSLGRIRRDQLALFQELDRVATALGVPPRRQPMVPCPRCGTCYAPDLTGCPRCGRAKPKNATPVSVHVSASQYALDAIPKDRATSAASPAD